MMVKFAAIQTQHYHFLSSMAALYFYAGILGTVVYSIMFLICLFKSFTIFFVLKEKTNLFLRKLFHILLLCFSFFELLYFISFIVDKRISKWGYSLHLVGNVLFLLAYSSAAQMWGQTVVNRADYEIIKLIALCLNFMIIVVFTGNLICLGTSSTFSDFSDSFHYMLEAKNLSELIILVVVTSWLLRRTHLLRMNLVLMTVTSDNVDASVSTMLKTRALQRLKMIQFGILSIIPRILFMIFLTVRDFVSMDIQLPDNITWFICTNFIPFCVPAIALIYLTRTAPAVYGPNVDSNKAWELEIEESRDESRFDGENIDSVVRRFTIGFERSSINMAARGTVVNMNPISRFPESSSQFS